MTDRPTGSIIQQRMESPIGRSGKGKERNGDGSEKVGDRMEIRGKLASLVLGG